METIHMPGHAASVDAGDVPSTLDRAEGELNTTLGLDRLARWITWFRSEKTFMGRRGSGALDPLTEARFDALKQRVEDAYDDHFARVRAERALKR